MTKSSPPYAPILPNEKTRTVAMKPSMNAARTEQTAPEITPTTMSPSRQSTPLEFPARLSVSSQEAMNELAAGLAPHVRPGDVIAVEGGLGSGKTTFVRGLAQALLGSDLVTSPTFTFWHRYPNSAGKIAFEHLDLYRIDDEAELCELGLEDAFRPDAVTAIEWPERAPSLVPRPDWRVRISGSGDEPRQVCIDRNG